MIRSTVNETAMIKGTADALAFSKHQLKLLENLEMKNYQQSWDPLEDASTYFYLKQKRLAIRDRAYKKILRDQARKEYIVLIPNQLEAERGIIKAKNWLRICKIRCRYERKRATYATKMMKVAVAMERDFAQLMCEMITIRAVQQHPLCKRFVVYIYFIE
jgi:hypothetical protein